MPDRTWHTNPVPLRSSPAMYLNMSNKEVAAGKELIESTPWYTPQFQDTWQAGAVETINVASQMVPNSADMSNSIEAMGEALHSDNAWEYLNRDQMNEATMFVDPYAPGEWVRGLYSAWDATAEQMQQDYHRGYLSRNMPHEVWAGKAMVGGRDLEAMKGTILDFDDDAENFLKDRMTSSKWNTKFWEDGRLPIYNLLLETPEDLLTIEPPEGWDAIDAMKFFKEKDPDAFKRYSLALGGEQALIDITKDSRNQYEFFYRLGESLTLSTVGKSLAVAQRNWSSMDHIGHFVGTLGVHGILNDPDMMASMALSIALAIPTGTGSLAMGAIALGAKAATIANRGVRLAKYANPVIMGLGKSVNFTRKLQHWLPENIGPHLMKNILFNGKRFTAYKNLSGMKKVGVVTMGNVIEGAVTGSLAEVANQYQKTSRGVTDEWNWGVVGMGTLHEMGLSIVVNPIMGRAFRGLGWAASLGGTAAVRSMRPLGLGKYVDGLLEGVKSSLDPNATARNVAVVQSMMTLREGLSGLGLEEVSSQVGTIMNVLAANTDLDEVGIAKVLGDSVTPFINSTGAHTNPELTFIEAIVKNEAFANVDNAFKASLEGKIKLAAHIKTQAENRNQTIDEFLADNENKPEVLLGIDLLPEFNALREQAGGTPKWNAMNRDEKMVEIGKFLFEAAERENEITQTITKEVKEGAEDAGVPTNTFGGATPGEVIALGKNAAEKKLADERKKAKAAQDQNKTKPKTDKARKARAKRTNDINKNIEKLENFLGSLEEMENLNKSGALPTHLVEQLNSLIKQEARVRRKLDEIFTHKDFIRREGWKTLAGVFEDVFKLTGITEEKIPLSQLATPESIAALDSIIENFRDKPQDFISFRNKLEKFEAGNLDVNALQERLDKVNSELGIEENKQDALQEVFDQQKDIMAMLESPAMKAIMIENQAEAQGMIVGRDAMDENRRIIASTDAADLHPTFEEWKSSVKKRYDPDNNLTMEEVLKEAEIQTEEEWAAHTEQQIEEFIEGPVRHIVRRGLEQGWRPVASNAFNAGKKGVWFKVDDLDIFEPLMVNVDGIFFDANFNIDEIAMMRTLPSLQTAPNKRRKINKIILKEKLIAGTIETPDSLVSLGKANTAEGTIELNEDRLLVSEELVGKTKAREMEALANTFGHEVGHFQFNKLSQKQLSEFKKLTAGWFSPSAQNELNAGVIKTEEQIDNENFAEIWAEILDKPKFTSIFTTHPLPGGAKNEADIRAFIKKEFQDKAEANGPNRFRDRPPTRRGSVLIPTPEDFTELGKVIGKLKDRIEVIKKHINAPKHPGGTDNEDLREESVNKAELESLEFRLLDLYSSRDEIWKKSGLADEIKEESAKLEKDRIQYELDRNEHFRGTLADRNMWFAQLESVRNLLTTKKNLKAMLSVREQAFEAVVQESIDNQVPLIKGDLVNFLPMDSRVAKKWQASIEKNAEYANQQMTVQAARDVSKKAFAAARKTVNRLNVGDFDTSNMVYPPTPRMFNTSPLLNETADEDLLLVPINEDYLTSPRMEDVEAIQNTEEELKAFISLARQLENVSDSTHIDQFSTIHAARIYSAMFEGTNDYFFRVGMAPHVVFREAINSPDIVSSLESTFNTQFESLTEAQLRTEATNLRYKIDKVKRIAEERADAIRAKTEGWVKEPWTQHLDRLLTNLTTEGKKESLHDHYRVLNLLEAMESLQKTAMEDLFRVNKGYALELNDTTGKPSKTTSEFSVFKSAVMKSALDRYNDARMKGEFDALGIDRFQKNLNLTEDDFLYQEHAIGKVDDFDYAESIVTEVINNRLSSLREDFTLQSFGDGTLDYRDAKTLGEEIVDLVFRDKPYPGRNSLESVDGGALDSTELYRGEQESTSTRRPHWGEGTAYAPMPFWTFAGMVGEYKFRSRASHVLNTPLTEEGLKAAAEWRKTLKEHANPDVAGAGLPLTVRPRAVGATLSSQVMSRPVLKDFLLELFLDMPNIAHSFISDQETVSSETKMFKYDENFVSAFPRVDQTPTGSTQHMIGSGEDLIVPFGQMGNTFALELMNPELEGLGQLIIDKNQEAVEKGKAAWMAQNPDKEFTLLDLFDPVTTTDQQFSGRYVGKMLALAADPQGRAAVKNIFKELKNNPEAWGVKSEEDLYIVSGLLMASEFSKAENQNKADIQTLGKLGSVFESVKDLKTLDDWNAAYAAMEEGSIGRKRLDALREYFKVPTMRRDYEGGEVAFLKDFDSERGNEIEVLRDLADAYDLERFTQSEIEALARLTYNKELRQNEALIDYALMMSGREKDLALQYLRLDSSSSFEANFWKEMVVPAVRGPGVVIPKTNPIFSLDTHRQALDNVILDWTVKTYGQENVTDTNIAKVRKKYDKVISEAKLFLQARKDDGLPTLEPGTTDFETYQLILHGQVDAKGNEIKGSAGLSYRDIGFFRALNMYNSTAYKLDMPHMEEVSELLGFKEFNAKDWLGLENHLLYQLFLPTQKSHRTSPVFGGMGMNSMGIVLERVASNKQGFKDFMTEAMANITEPSTLDYAFKAGEYITQHNSDAFGMFDIVDNPYVKMSKIEADAKVDEIMTLHEMLYYAQEDKLPKDIYPNYTVEDDPNAMLAATLTQWKDNSIEMQELLPEIIDFERKLYDQGDAGKAILKLKKKANVIYNPTVARDLQVPERHFFSREGKKGELYADTVQSPAGIQTSSPAGPLAMMPLTKRYSIMDKGNIPFQRIALQRQIDRRRNWLNVRLDQQLVEETPLLKGTEFGYVSPYNKGDLPQMLDVPEDLLAVIPDNEVGREASRIYTKVSTWVKNRGIDEAVLQDPHMWPYLLNVIKVETLQSELITQMSYQSRRSGDTSRQRKTVDHWRQQWLTSLFELSNVSYDIQNSKRRGASLEEAALRIGIKDPDVLGKSYYDIFTRNRKRSKEASEKNREGYLLIDTLLQQSLEAGVVPGAEGMTIRNKFTGANEGFVINPTQLVANSKQAHDFMKFMVKMLWNDGIYQVIKNDPMYSQFKNDKGLTSDDMSVFPEDMKKDLYAKAGEYVKNMKGFTFEARVTEKGIDILDLNPQQNINMEFNKNTFKAVQRNALAEAGFGLMVMAPSELIGQNVELVITPERAMLLLSYLENFRLVERVEQSAHTRVPTGTKLGEDGTRIRSRSDEQIARDALAPNETEVREAAMIETDAVKRIVSMLADKTPLYTVNTGVRKTTVMGTMEFLNNDLYRRPGNLSEDGSSKHGFVEDYLEAYISPIQKLLHNVDKNQTNIFDPLLVSELTDLIDSTRKGTNSLHTSTLIQLSLLLRETKVTEDVAQAFLDPDTYNETDITTGWQRAKDLVQRVSAIREAGGRGHFFNTQRGRDLTRIYQEGLANLPGVTNETSLTEIKRHLEQYAASVLHQDSPHKGRGEAPTRLKGFTKEEINGVFEYAMGEAYTFEALNDVMGIEGDIANTVSEEAVDFSINDQLGFNFDTAGKQIKNIVKTHKDTIDWAKGTRNNHVLSMLHTIEEAVQNDKINLSPKEAQIMRAIIVRQYERNKSLLDDISLTFEERFPSQAIINGRSASIIMNTEEMKGTPLTAVKIFAHELAHIGATRFLSTKDGLTWLALYRSKAGKAYLRKTVQAWHGGRFNQDAKKEFKRYLTNPDEFIAGLVSYKLFNGALPEIPNLTIPEAKVWNTATNNVQKIIHWFAGHWNRINTVFVHFRKGNPELSKQIDTLTLHTMGYDPMDGPLVRLDNDSTQERFGFNSINRRFEKMSDSWEMSTADLSNTLTEFETLNAMESLDQKQQIRLAETANILFEGEGRKPYGVTGITRTRKLQEERNLKEFMHDKDVFSVDLYKLLNTANPNGIHANPAQRATVVEMAIDKMEEQYGEAFRGHAGSFLSKQVNSLHNMLGSENKGTALSLGEDFLTGPAASRLTYNGWHPLMVSMSAMVDDRVAMMMGQYANINGLPSVTKALGEIRGISTILKEHRRRMTSIFGNLAFELSGKTAGLLRTPEREYLSHLDAQIMLKIDNPTHEFDFDVDDNKMFEKLKPDQQESIKDSMDKSVTALSSYLKQLVKDGVSDGSFGEGFTAVVPYRLNNTIRVEDTRVNFKRELGNEIKLQIVNELNNSDTSIERIDPLVFFGTKSLPRIHNKDTLRTDLMKMREANPPLYNWVMQKFTAKREKQKGGSVKISSESLRLTLEEELSIPKIGETGKRDANTMDENAIAMVQSQWSQILKDISRGKIKWSELAKVGVDVNALKVVYENTIESKDPEVRNYMESLRVEGIKAYVPQFIYYRSRGDINSKFVTLDENSTPIDMHIHNLANRAAVGMYFPNDIWSIPQVSSVLENNILKDLFIWNPTEITEEFRKGLGDEIHERKMMRENFNLHGTFGDFVNLVSDVIHEPPSGALRRPDGTEMSQKEMKELSRSAQVLHSKWEMTKGIARRTESPSPFMNAIADYAPAITRIVFGNNLSLASAIVEGGINVLSEGLGRGNLSGSIRGLLAPILNIPIVNKELRRRVGADIAYHVESLTQSFIPDFEKPANSEADSALLKAMNWSGRQSLRPAQWTMTSIASQRAVSTRLFITDNLDNLTTLVRNIEETPLDMTNPKDFKARMREAGFNMTAVLEQDLNLVRYMLNAGLLSSGRFPQMKRMIRDFLKRNPGERYYVINEMHSRVLLDDPNQADYRTNTDIIVGLREVEKSFIHEVILEPKAFDIFTGNPGSTGEGASISPLDSLFEIFRRHPILFVSQHVFRGMNEKHPLKWGFGLTSLLVLDIVYMLALRMSQGENPEDLLDDLDNNKFKNIVMYMSRLPILGRWGSEIAGMVGGVLTGFGAQPAGRFIGAAALITAINQLYKAGKGLATGSEYAIQDMINAFRIIPVLGDSVIRTGLYTGLNMLGDPYDIPRRKRRSGGGGGGYGQSGGSVGNYGINTFDSPLTYEGYLGGLAAELTQYAPLPQRMQQQISNLAPPWTGGQNAWNATRNQERDSYMDMVENQERTELQDQYDRDAGVDRSIDVERETEGPGTIEDKIRAQKGSSGDLADTLGID